MGQPLTFSSSLDLFLPTHKRNGEAQLYSPLLLRLGVQMVRALESIHELGCAEVPREGAFREKEEKKKEGGRYREVGGGQGAVSRGQAGKDTCENIKKNREARKM